MFGKSDQMNSPSLKLTEQDIKHVHRNNEKLKWDKTEKPNTRPTWLNGKCGVCKM